MIRKCAALAVVFALVGSLPADDTDPVREKLFAAKNTYDAEVKAVRKQVEEWFDKREEAARKIGDKKVVDQIKAERAPFVAEGEIPNDAPAALKERQDKALKALEEAYAQAVKDYTKVKKDTEAAAVEAELKNITAQIKTINLLARVDLKTQVLGGEWKRDAALTGTAGDRHARLRLPYEPGEEYDLEVRCQRVAGDNCFAVGLVAVGRQVVAVLDAWPENGYASGIELIQSKEANNNATTVKGRLLKPDQMYTVVYSIRSGKIEVAINGIVAIKYKGGFDKFSLRQDARIANGKSLFIFFNPNTSFQIDRLTVTPVKGKGTIK